MSLKGFRKFAIGENHLITTWWGSITASMALVCASLCIIPPLVTQDMYVSCISDSSPSPLQSAWDSGSMIHAAIPCLVVSCPLLLDFLADSVAFSHSPEENIMKSVLLLSLMVPNGLEIAFTLMEIKHFYRYLPSMMSARIVVLMFFLYFSMMKYGSSIWKPKFVIPIMSLWMTGIVVAAFSSFDMFYSPHLNLVRTLMWVGGTTGFVVLSICWTRYLLFQKHDSVQAMNNYCCNINLLAFVSMIVGFWVMSISTKFGPVSLPCLSHRSYLSLNIMLSAVTVAVTVFSGRITRIQFIENQVCDVFI